jgi:hypothetical protein
MAPGALSLELLMSGSVEAIRCKRLRAETKESLDTCESRYRKTAATATRGGFSGSSSCALGDKNRPREFQTAFSVRASSGSHRRSTRLIQTVT